MIWGFSIIRISAARQRPPEMLTISENLQLHTFESFKNLAMTKITSKTQELSKPVW